MAPSISASASATSGAKSEGVTSAPWYQGDFVNAWGDGDAASGARDQGGTGGAGLSQASLLIAGFIVLAAVLWKTLSK